MNIKTSLFRRLKMSYKIMLCGYATYKFMIVYREKFAVRPRGLDAGETPTVAASCGFQMLPLDACALTSRE
jgi:hypothetical protein